jgi:HEAT repeat protein
VSAKLKEIVSNLHSSDESDRCYAIEDLKEVNDPKIVDYLIDALKDPSVRVRETATDVLVLVGGNGVAEGVASLLESEEVPIRNAAIEILEKMGPAALNTLETCMESSSIDVRKFAIDTVGKILNQTKFDSHEPKPRIFSVLIDRLWASNANISGAAAEALGLSKDDSVIAPLMSHLSGPNKSPWLQCNIIVALSRIGTPNARSSIQNIDKNELFEEAKTFLEMALNGEAL